MHRFLPSSNHHHSGPRKIQGNISLLVILVLLSSSLFSLLAIAQLKNLMTHGTLTYNYFRAHYIAKAGLELALTETYFRGVGFQTDTSSGSAIVTSNFSGYENRDPYFTITMKSRSSLIGNSVKLSTCSSSENQKILHQGESIVLPLFYDNGTPPHRGIVTGSISYTQLSKSEIQKITFKYLEPNNAELVFGLFAFSSETLMDMVDMVTATGTSLKGFFDNFNDTEKNITLLNNESTFKYLTIVNPTDEEISFCIETSKELPVADTLITVQAHYGDTEVGLQAIFSEPFPSFLQSVSEIVN